MLVLSRRKGEEIVIDENIRVTVLEMNANRVRLGIVAPATVPVHREEVYRKIVHRSDPEHPRSSLAEATE